LHDREHYDFFEISHNNATDGQQHYDQMLSVRERVAEEPIPLNNVKIYGGEIGRWTTSVEEGTRRFWRNIFGGCASARFHRPGPSHHFFGIGLSELAQAHLRSMRMATDAIEVFYVAPRNDLLSDHAGERALGDGHFAPKARPPLIGVARFGERSARSSRYYFDKFFGVFPIPCRVECF
jgi:hypothetical protein